MQTLFISDLHLGPHCPHLVEGFRSFLKNHAANADQLYILGDFFDAWIGDDDDDALFTSIKEDLQHYSQNHKTFFIHGNRDFLIGQRFAEETGLTLLADSAVIDLNGRPTLVMHGDTLCTQDMEYLQFRAMVRNPAWQQQILSLPLPHRRHMAAELRQKSKSMNAMKAEDIMDVTPEEVTKVMTDHNVDLLIHGHTHRPAIHNIEANEKPAQRWVLGDWDKKGWYIRADESGLDLIEFELEAL
jgi:UDP-2,3-diacylglucosamine hydrolase